MKEVYFTLGGQGSTSEKITLKCRSELCEAMAHVEFREKRTLGS